MAAGRGELVYVVGAGFSAGLGFPTISGLLPAIWPRLVSAGIADSIDVRKREAGILVKDWSFGGQLHAAARKQVSKG